mgnify:CR=1 FL=1
MKGYDKYKETGIKWLPLLPIHWCAIKISALFEERKQKVSDTIYAPLSVSKLGIIPQLETAIKTDNGDNRKLVRIGDFVVNSRSDRKGSCGISHLEGSVSIINIVLKPRKELNKTYFHYLLRSNGYVEEYYRLGRGIVADLWTTRYSELKNINIPLPPPAEQEKIVRYLEDKTSKIDEVILAKEKQIKLLQELKDAEIANVITRGLNPDVKMKRYDSLLSSECPEHWCITRNKSFMSLVGEKVGRQSVSYTLLSLTTKGVIIRDVESGKGKFPKDFDTYQIVQRGELVFCLFDIDETPRTVGIVETDGMVTGAYTVLRVNEKYAIPEYVYYYYLCVDNIKALKPYYSGLRKTVRADKFLQLYIPVPSVEEQRTIIAYIENKNNKIEALVKNLETEIAYLKEYKQKLIADCVTGQINVQCEQ